MKTDASNPLDELGRDSEGLRRAKEKQIDARRAEETARSVLDRAQAGSLEAEREVERFRERVKTLAAQISDE
jgi:hypothetical protein